MDNQKILMIGPDSQGGITSVINLLLNNGLSSSVKFLPSYIGGNLTCMIKYFFNFLVQYMLILLSDKSLQVVHIHSASRGSFLRKSMAFYLAKMFRKKVIFHLHGAEFNIFYDKSNRIVKRIISDILNKSDLILVLSKRWKSDIAKKCSNPNIKVLYNPTKVKKINDRSSNEVNVLFMGRIGKRKGAYDILEAARLIENKQVKINMYGDGEIDELSELAQKNGLNDKLNIPGWIKGQEIEKAYRNSDIFILPSYNEGLPMSVLEAMSYGLPIVSTPVGGTAEAVDDGINGYLIQPGDYKALAEKIDFLAGNKLIRDKMSQESHFIAGERFDVKVIVKQLEDIYNVMLLNKDVLAVSE